MTRILPIGFGAGLASALLFSVVITGSPLAMILSYAAPLPILIVALGWTHRAGLLAVAAAALVIALVLRPTTALAYAIGSGLPAWGIAYLALLGRPVSDEPAAPLEWYPLGRLLVWIAGLASLIVLTGSLALGGGDHAAYRDLLVRLVDTFIKAETAEGAAGRVPDGVGARGSSGIAGLVVTLVPAIAASVFCLFLVVNTWLAAKTVAISGRLTRPWPAVPGTRMPRGALALLGGGIVAALLPGYVGVFGTALVGTAAMAFALQGLALLHHVTAGRAGRRGLLVCTYILTVFFGGTILPLMAIVGLVDTASPLRTRLAYRFGAQPD